MPKIEEVTTSEDEYADAEPTFRTTNVKTEEQNENENIISDSLQNKLNLDNNKNIAEELISDSYKTENDDEIFKECIDDIIDEEGLKEFEKDMSPEKIEENRIKAEGLKKEGNELFKNTEYEKSVDLYTEALKVAPSAYPKERAILYANRAAAAIKVDSKNAAINDCTEAIKLDPEYTKAYLRRAKLFEETEKLDESLADYNEILKLQPGCREALSATYRLPQMIEERNEKLKTEMLGKLKDLGNMILKPFGLSTNNFQMQQDPSTGSYSINFNQNSS